MRCRTTVSADVAPLLVDQHPQSEEQVMMIRRGFGFAAASVLSIMALIFPLAGISGAPRGPNWKANVSFNVEVFNAATNESVMLSGTEALKLTVIGDAAAGWNTSLTATLHHTVGTGVTSDGKYKAKGHTTLTSMYPPGPPVRPTTYPATFVLHPPGPCRVGHPSASCSNPSAVEIPVTITLTADGSVASVQVGHSD
jgi:hypothetical protein